MAKDGAIWVDAFKVGDLVVHPRYGEQRYTQPELLEAITNFRKLKAKGYATTLLREHGTEDSYIYGEIVDVRIDELGYFQCLTSFTRRQERDAYNDGILKEFSPGFAREWLDPHTGEILNNVLIELSFTSRAYQRNLRAPQDINPGVTLADAATPLHYTPTGATSIQPQPERVTVEEEENMPVEATEEEEQTFSQEEAYQEMCSRMDKMSAMLEEMRAFMMPANEEEPAQMSDDATEVERLSARIAELEATNTRLHLESKGFEGSRLANLVQLSQKLSKDDFAQVVEMSANRVVVQEEIGAAGVAVVETVDELDAIIDEAAAKGFRYSNHDGKFSAYIAANYADQADAIIERVKQQ